MDGSKKQKKMAKDANYIPRTEKFRKRYKRENVTTSILNKKGLPRTSAKICVTVRIQDPAQLLTKLLIKLRNQLSSAIIKQDFIVFIV